MSTPTSPGQYGLHLPNNICKYIFINNKKYLIWFEFHWILFAKDPIDNK